MATPSPDKDRADKDSFGLPTINVLRRLKLSPEVGYYLVSRGIPLPTCVPKIKTPEPRGFKGSAFDPEKVDRVLAAFNHLRHTQGRLAGQPLTPDPWQIAYIIAPVFGWVRQNDYGEWVRIIRSLYVDVPRKNGKTTIAGGLAMYMTAADGEMGAQVIAAASTKDQAGFAFAPVKKLAESAPALRGHVKALANRIIHPASNSYFGVIASSADAQHGANIHAAIIDELHVHKTPDLVEAIETGTGSREQPLIIIITTADSGKPNTIYARKRSYIEKLANRVGQAQDFTTYGVVWGLEDDATDLFSEKAISAANPGFPISPNKAFMESEIKKAKNSPAELASFKRLHLGIRTRQTTAFINLTDWRRNAGKLTEPELYGRECFGGLDLGSVSDLTAFALIFPRRVGGELEEGFDLLFRFWTPEENLEALDKRTADAASKAWVKQGWLSTTPGNVTDYDFIKQRILDDCDLFDIRSIGIDPWNATHLMNQLQEEGVPMATIRQGFFSMSGPLKEMSRLTLKGKKGAEFMRHGGNPVMEWMIDNLAVAIDPAGNVKPDKAESGDKIDGVSALANAFAEYMNPDEQNQRGTGDLIII